MIRWCLLNFILKFIKYLPRSIECYFLHIPEFNFKLLKQRDIIVVIGPNYYLLIFKYTDTNNRYRTGYKQNYKILTYNCLQLMIN